MKKHTILIADDHPLILEGVRRVLEAGGFDVVGIASNGRELVEEADRLQPDAIVADLSMPHLNGIEGVRQILHQRPHSRIILLTMHADANYALEAFAAGALGYVLKNGASSELVAALRQVMDGRTYVSEALAPAVKHAQDGRRRVQLTPRQREILQMFADGKSVKEIASSLNLSVRTVEFHKYRLMEALQVQNSVELTRFALRHGLVT